MPKLTTFTVEGIGVFPLDMLRYDQCWPSSSDDVHAIYADGRMPGETVPSRRKVRLATHGSPTPARWASFMWRIQA